MLKQASIIFFLLILTTTAFAVTLKESKESYLVLSEKKNTHEKGKVKMTVFFDFFCPHCHQFDTVVVSILQREFGKKLKVTYIGFPIIYEDSVIPLEAFELAKDEGKGEEMKQAIFDAIYYQRKDGANRDILLSLAKSLGLSEKFNKGLTSGIKKKTVLEGKDFAKSFGATSTPTVIIDGNVLIKDNTLATISSVINNILDKDGK
ncbi:MAG: hypothetical protein A3D21_01245 [Nitrospirae bacterium RIFCSPHIGHO2_02_FULL_42_12]|nr:MAG: hypothetical protein A3D21_01245 [Nitrospirae bacterium RIFCSPHIGHO2_02_FULL_42_12]